ncbi:uncharacterized protein LOC119919708 [Tachyglossus aculeatus]|uniref:uncharacterized protein LOC119919708 n=1 Tax=Tachyglossus aculeatus TaxID=9261 RepID=UPI0018F48B02|nr:uncharacterized protein LOC119919708 [Tachyglossus aculeatus]
MSADKGNPPAGPPCVTMKELTFFPVCAEFMKPTKLVPRNSRVFQKAELSFMANRKNFKEVSHERSIQPRVKTFQVQLRFCLWDTQGPQPDCLPTQLTITVNEKICFIPVDSDDKDYNRPVDITQLVCPSDEAPHRITLLWSLSDSRDFAMSVCLVEQLTAENLLKQLKNKKALPRFETLILIQKLMPAVRECALPFRRVRASLLCPLGQSLVTVPCRSLACSHFQIFDAVLYLQKNEKEETWMCPICNQGILYQDLVIDEFFFIVLHTVTCEEINCEAIDILHDGTWCPAGYFLDVSELSEDPGFTGLRGHRFQRKRKVHFVSMKEWPCPEPTRTVRVSTTEKKMAQGSDSQAGAPAPNSLLSSDQQSSSNLRKRDNLNVPFSCGKNELQRGGSRFPAGDRRDLLDCCDAPGTSGLQTGSILSSIKEIPAVAPIKSCSSNMERRALAITTSRGLFSDTLNVHPGENELPQQGSRIPIGDQRDLFVCYDEHGPSNLKTFPFRSKMEVPTVAQLVSSSSRVEPQTPATMAANLVATTTKIVVRPQQPAVKSCSKDTCCSLPFSQPTQGLFASSVSKPQKTCDFGDNPPASAAAPASVPFSRWLPTLPTGICPPRKRLPFIPELGAGQGEGLHRQLVKYQSSEPGPLPTMAQPSQFARAEGLSMGILQREDRFKVIRESVQRESLANNSNFCPPGQIVVSPHRQMGLLRTTNIHKGGGQTPPST